MEDIGQTISASGRFRMGRFHSQPKGDLTIVAPERANEVWRLPPRYVARPVNIALGIPPRRKDDGQIGIVQLKIRAGQGELRSASETQNSARSRLTGEAWNSIRSRSVSEAPNQSPFLVK